MQFSARTVEKFSFFENSDSKEEYLPGCEAQNTNIANVAVASLHNTSVILHNNNGHTNRTYYMPVPRKIITPNNLHPLPRYFSISRTDK